MSWEFGKILKLLNFKKIPSISNQVIGILGKIFELGNISLVLKSYYSSLYLNTSRIQGNLLIIVCHSQSIKTYVNFPQLQTVLLQFSGSHLTLLILTFDNYNHYKAINKINIFYLKVINSSAKLPGNRIIT